MLPLRLGEGDVAAGVGFPGEAEDHLADDVALHLVGAAADVHGEAPSSGLGPAAALGRVGRRAIAAGAAEVDAEVGDGGAELGDGELQDRALDAGDAAAWPCAVRTRAFVRSNSRPSV